MDDGFYYWRRLDPEQRAEVLAERQRQPRPWHGPPHSTAAGQYLMTAACFEHQSYIGKDSSRMAEFEAELLDTVAAHASQVNAWVVLPNHYHVLVATNDLRGLFGAIGQLHGRTSFRWNGQDNSRRRQVWHRCVETAIKSEGHYWASLNYVLHNPVRHGYVTKWTEWPYSSATRYLEEMGREEAVRIFRCYPILDYGKDWDPP
jgi:putative transposase